MATWRAASVEPSRPEPARSERYYRGMTKIRSGRRSAVSKRLAAGMQRSPGSGRFVGKLPAAGTDPAPSGPATAPAAPSGSDPAPGGPEPEPLAPLRADPPARKLWPSRR